MATARHQLRHQPRRVYVWGSQTTIDSASLARCLIKVDLQTIGRPMIDSCSCRKNHRNVGTNSTVITCHQTRSANSRAYGPRSP